MRAAIALCFLAALGSRRAEAMPSASSSGADAVHLDYDVPPGCPDAARFLTQVENRTGALRGPPRTISLVIRHPGDRMEGVVRVDDGPERRLNGRAARRSSKGWRSSPP